MKNNKYILYSMAFLQGLVFYGAFSVIFRESRGLSLSNVFLLESIFLITMLIFEIPWGVIGDKFGYKKTLVISFGLFLISKIIFYFSYSFLGFLLESVIAAIAISGISGCDSALLYISVDKSESNRAFGVYQSMSTAGFLFSSLVSGILIKYSIDFLALATIIPYFFVFLLSFALTDIERIKEVDSENEKESIIKSLSRTIKNKKIIGFVIAVGILSETTHSIAVFLNQPLYLKSSIDLEYFGILTALMQVATFIAIKADKIKIRFGEKKLLKGALMLVIFCNLILIKSNIALLTIVLIFLIEGAFAITSPITETIKNESITSVNRATILSIYAMIANIGACFINLLISLASAISVEVGLLCCLTLNLCAMIPLGFYLKNNDKKNKILLNANDN
ncbi:MAG: MFS transporter [Sarcina sp.]